MKRLLFLSLLVLTLASCVTAQDNNASRLPKHEFRGAWMHIIGQQQYAKMTPEQTRQYLIDQLNLLQKANCNAVICQRT